MSTNLYHISALRWAGEKNICLCPGTQCAEGVGVYFSEGEPRLSAAEGTHAVGAGVIFCLVADNATGWWRTKNSTVKKFRRPRTWHTASKKINFSDLHQIGEINKIPVITGEWRFS